MLTSKFKEYLGPLFPIANKCRLFYFRMKYKGNSVFCPCCKSSFREFVPFGNSKRKNARCPKCESLERDRLLWMYFENKTNLYKAPLKVLHIAPEIVFFNHFKNQKNIDYFPGDIYPHLYPKGTKYFNLLEPNLDDNSYDVIICNHVFQYIEDDTKAIQNLYKLMKPGGWGIMQVPINTARTTTYEDNTITDPIEREKAFGLKEHVRYYSYDYADKLRVSRFNVLVDDYTKAFTDAEIYKFGFWKSDAIYYCTK
jgi:SAM-dependent methyltransferase